MNYFLPELLTHAKQKRLVTYFQFLIYNLFEIIKSDNWIF